MGVGATFLHRAFKIGDAKDINLNSQQIFNGSIAPDVLPSKILYSYWHAVWNDRITVAGTWTIQGNAANTDYDFELTGATGSLNNETTHADNDEIHFGNVLLNAGTYKVIIVYRKESNKGILEILHGTTSLGTVDCYNAASSYNNVSSFTYSPAILTPGNFRLKVSGKNGASTNYYLYVSRIEIIRTG